MTEPIREPVAFDAAAALADMERAAIRVGSFHAPQDAVDAIHKLVAHLKAALVEVERLQAFKNWCHTYLDGKGVPHHPPGTHGAEGCRIGDRMDYVFAELNALKMGLYAIQELAADELRRLGAVPGSVVAQIEADAAALLAAKAGGNSN